MRGIGFLVCGILAAVIAGTATVQADLIVTSSTAPGLKLGQVIGDAQEITLGAASKATLIARNGDVVRLSGPYQGVPGSTAATGDGGFPNLIPKLAQLFQEHQSTVLGASRQLGNQPPMPWMIDITRPGPQCVLAGGPATLWRPRGSSGAALSLQTAGGDTVAVDWPADRNTATWPTALPLGDGDRIDLTLGDRRISMTVHLVPSAPAKFAHYAVGMAERDCKSQAFSLLGWLK